MDDCGGSQQLMEVYCAVILHSCNFTANAVTNPPTCSAMAIASIPAE
jgi:hypothetical protein